MATKTLPEARFQAPFRPFHFLAEGRGRQPEQAFITPDKKTVIAADPGQRRGLGRAARRRGRATGPAWA